MNTSRMNRRHFLQAAGAATLGSALAACGGTTTVGSGKVTITYWDWWVTQAPWVDGEIALFEKAHPNITVKKTTQGGNTYPTLLPLSFKSHNSTDVFMIPNPPTFGDQVTQNWLRPVSVDTSWRNDFPQGSFVEGTNMLNGKVYSAPLTGSAPWVQLYIHNGLFKQAGLTNADGSVRVPRTWDDVTQAAEAIVKKTNGSAYGLGFGASGWNLLPLWMELFVRGGGSPGGGYDKDLRVGKYTYGTDRNYADFLSLMVDWKKRGYFYPNSVSISDETARAFFERGKFGMTIGGVWNQAEWTSHNFTDYTLTTLVGPQADHKGYFYYTPGSNFVGVSTQTKHPDEAQAWFEWLYSPEAGQRLVEKGIDISVWSIIVVQTGGGMVFSTFLFMGYFSTIDAALDDAARVDGATFIQLYWRVMLPLAGPMLATVALFSFISNWNSFLVPLVFTLGVPELRTLAVGMYAFIGQNSTNWTYLCAGSVITLAPIMLIFVLLQRYFINGIAGAIKS